MLRIVLSALGTAFALPVVAADLLPSWLRWPRLNGVVFASAETGLSTYVATGFKRSVWSPSDTSRFVIMSVSGRGEYRRRETSAPLALKRGQVEQTSFLIGHEWRGPGLTLTAYVGGEFSNEMTNPASSEDGPRYGVRGQFDLVWQPDQQKLVDATLTLGSSQPDAWGRLAVGHAIWWQAFAGVEGSAYVKEDYSDLRLGLHVSRLPIGPLRLRLSGGAQFTHDGRAGGYIGLSGYADL